MQHFYSLLARLSGATQKPWFRSSITHLPGIRPVSGFIKRGARRREDSLSSSLNIDAQNMLGQWEDLHL